MNRRNLFETRRQLLKKKKTGFVVKSCFPYTNLDCRDDSGNFSVSGYLPIIQKDSTTHVHGLAVYVKEGLPFAQGLSLENYADSYI